MPLPVLASIAGRLAATKASGSLTGMAARGLWSKGLPGSFGGFFQQQLGERVKGLKSGVIPRNTGRQERLEASVRKGLLLKREGEEKEKIRKQITGEYGVEARGEIGKTLQGEKLGDVGAGFFKAGEKIAEMFGPAGAPVAAAMKFGATIMESLEKLREWGEGLHKANMQFAEFSAAMSGVQARQQVRDIQLSQERGERRAETAERVAEAKSRFERAAAPMEDIWAKVQGELFVFLSDEIGTPIVNGFDGLLELFVPWYSAWKEQKIKDAEHLRSDEWLQEEAEKGRGFDSLGQPDRFRAGRSGGDF